MCPSSDNNNDFYTALPLHKHSLLELYSDDANFTPLPEDWYVLVADVKNSTLAVADNKHNQVNLAATGCIVAVLNRLKTTGIKVPYFFGGDGATFLIPNGYKAQLLKVLSLQREHVKAQWGLELVIGYMSLRDIRNEGYHLRLAKNQINDFLQIPVVLGTGLKFAEDLIKRTFSPYTDTPSQKETPDLSGLECRWDKIAPPKSDNAVICLLVYCAGEMKQRQVYYEVLKELTHIFGNIEQRQPISIPKLKLNATFEKIKNEILATSSRLKYRHFLKTLLETYAGKLYFKYSNAGRLYLRMTKDLSETIMLDGLINTIISGTSSQTTQLKQYLDQLEAARIIVYGLHVADSSVMSCYVEDRKSKHAHFVDGAEGGYTKAAEMMKSKFQRMNT